MTENVFNIKKFVKEEYKDFNLSANAIKELNTMIQTVITVAVDQAVRNAEKMGNRTILPQHFNWDIVEDFKVWMEEKQKGV